MDRSKFIFSELQPLSIHFDGSVSKREVAAGREYTMELWFARPGDIVVAKIDLKNGAVGIVPEDWQNVAVTGHFAVYEPDRKKLMPEFFHRLIQTSSFKANLWRNKVGAEGRKEVKLDFFESALIPLPPLAEQRVIVERWRSAQSQIADANDRVEKLRADSSARLLADLSLTLPTVVPMRKSFAVRWADLPTWSGSAAFKRLSVGDIHAGKFPVARGHDFLTDVCHGCSAPPSPVPTALEILKISAVTRGEFVPTEKKFAADNPRVRKQFDLRKGDVLLCRTNGTLGYVGMSALVPEDQSNLIFPDKVIRVRVKPEIIQPEYLWLILQTPFLRSQIEAAARTAVGNYAIGGKDIWNFEVPLPPLEVQRKLVDRVAAARIEMARERTTAEKLREKTAIEIEAMILGANPVSTKGS